MKVNLLIQHIIIADPLFIHFCFYSFLIISPIFFFLIFFIFILFHSLINSIVYIFLVVIATSDGSAKGLESRKAGRCNTDNMRLAITICGKYKASYSND